MKITRIDTSSSAFRFKKPRKAFTPFDFSDAMHDEQMQHRKKDNTFKRRLQNEKDGEKT